MPVLAEHESLYLAILRATDHDPDRRFASMEELADQLTGVMHETLGTYWANLVFHDLAGWLMMPLALALLWCELALLSLLIIEDAPAAPAAVLSRSPHPPGWSPSSAAARSPRASAS